MGILVHDGQERKAIIPAHRPYYEQFTITYRPLASYENEQYRNTNGPRQIELVMDKLIGWTLVMDKAAAEFVSGITKKPEQPGQPLPILPEVLKVLDGMAFESIYLGILGILPAPEDKTKTGVDVQKDALKN